ncbi:uncharacterized protein LOC134290133 [Aedes albopictus]|uniref:CCHC-type domain-containing protein n=1 Tax=Aedes albopictus TaxID=7160 RepID=A0ABM1YC81_AEDAL
MRSPQQREEAEQQQEAFLQRSAQQLPTNSGWGVPQQHPKVLVAKNWAEELHEFVDKKHNVHKDIKELVLKIRRALGSAVKEWTNVLQRAEIAESELASTKNALAAKTLQQQTPRTVPGNLGKKEKLARTENTPMSATKRHRSSPGDERPGGSKRQRDNLRKRLAAAEAEQVGVGNRETQWQTVQRKGKAKQTNAGARPKVIRRSVKKKGEAIVVKTREESYLEVLRTIRTAPELKDFGADVQKVRRTRSGEMIFELKKDSKNKSSSYKELAASVVGDTAQVRAVTPEVVLQCVDIDEITTAEEVKTAIKEQMEIGDVEMSVRLRRGPSGTQVAAIKLPVNAADKALRIGKVKVGFSECPLRVSQQPEICFRCQEFGHLARNCRGPDRSKLYRRCGDEGHKAQELEVVQINLNHCDTAQQLLCQSTKEAKCDVAIISDPYRIPSGNGNWVADEAGTAAIWTVGRYPLQEVVYRAIEGFVIAKVNGVYICSCYAPPRWTIERFNQVLDQILEKLGDRRPVIIAGDFNAWAVEWGSRLTNPRGWSLLETVSRLNLVLANEGSTSTYRREGRESIIDVTFCSPTVVRSMNWRVSEDYTHSDHQAIRYRLGERVQTAARGDDSKGRKWRTEAFDEEVFAEVLRYERNMLNLSPDELVSVLVRACDATMPRKIQPRDVRRPVYWWNGRIAELRRNCLRARRRMQRAHTDEEREERRPLFRAARAALKKGIKLSKAACMQELCQKLKAVVDGLFPQHEPTVWPPTPYEEVAADMEESRISNQELITVAKSLKPKKAPGLDGISNLVLKTAIQQNPDMFRTTLQKCIDDGNFPDRWKRQKLVLLPKPGKPPEDPSAYRPIYSEITLKARTDYRGCSSGSEEEGVQLTLSG